VSLGAKREISLTMFHNSNLTKKIAIFYDYYCQWRRAGDVEKMRPHLLAIFYVKIWANLVKFG